MEITILGTSSMVPTKERNHTSIYIDLGKSAFLFDCGEGTQRQLTFANLKASKITHIFISHWHGDHVLGLPGLIQTLAARDYEGRLAVHGPKGTKERFSHMFKTFVFDNSIDMDIYEILEDGIIFDDDSYIVEAYGLNHSIEAYGFVLKEKDRRKMIPEKLEEFSISGKDVGELQKGNSITVHEKQINPDDVSFIAEGKKIGLIFDTTLAQNLMKIAQDSDILVCEATYLNNLEDKASEYKHMTVAQAAQVASQSNAKKLVLIHLSARYSETSEILDEAKSIFPNTVVAHDLMKIKLL